MNIQRRTARVSIRLLRCLILWEYDRSRHENINVWRDLDVVAFRIVHESGVIGRSVVRQPMHGELTETIVAGAA